MDTKRTNQQLALIGVVFICALQYPFVAFFTPNISVLGIPFSLISLLFFWLALIVIIRLLVNRLSGNQNVEEDE